MSPENAVVANAVSFRFENWGQQVAALQGVSLVIPEGQWIMLIGPNGAGKTTFLNLISGALGGYSGTLLINGADARTFGPRHFARHVFHVRQDPAAGTAPLLTVFENMLVADPNASGLSRRRLVVKHSKSLADWGLEKTIHQLARDLSGGERQLLTLVIAQLRPSNIILLDEPLSALDPARGRIALELLHSLHKQQKTLVCVTHDPRVATTLGDRAVAFREGALAWDSDVSSVRTFEEVAQVWI